MTLKFDLKIKIKHWNSSLYQCDIDFRIGDLSYWNKDLILNWMETTDANSNPLIIKQQTIF